MGEPQNLSYRELPPHYLSVDRFLVVTTATIILTPIAVIGFGVLYKSLFDRAAVPDKLSGDVNQIVAGAVFVAIGTILLGWKIWLPLVVAAIIVGLPLWLLSLQMLFKRRVAPRLAVFVASVAVVVTTIGAAGFSVDAFYGTSNLAFLKLYSAFGAGAIVVGSLIAQVVYGR